MINFVFEEDLVEEAEASQGGTFGVLDTGVYDVTINFASLDKTEKGNNTLTLDITTDTGHNTKLWRVFGTIDKTWASGKENYGYKDFQAFAFATGLKSITPVDFDLKKDNGELVKKLSVVKELHGAKCKLAIQKQFRSYNGKDIEENIIHSSYNTKGQTYLEFKNGQEAAKIKKVAERLTDKKDKSYQANTTVEEEPTSLGGLL